MKKIKLKTLKQGQRFKYGEKEFVKLKALNGGCLCLAADVWFNARFDENDKNNWETSLLREKLTARIGEFIPTDNLIPFDRDLTTDNGMTDYGTCTDVVSLLTCDEYRKYRKLIPNCGKWHWTITADSLEYSCSVRGVISDGSLDSFNIDNLYGVRPLCILKSDTVVEVKDSRSHGNCTDINQVKMEKKTPETCWNCGKRIVKGRPIFILRGTIIRCCSLACLAYASLNIDEETSTGYIEEEENEDGNKNN